jgi:serine/threonine protein kinase
VRALVSIIGQTVSHYRVVESLGGMGIVCSARETILDRIVALKFLPPDSTKDQPMLDRFLREARAAAALNHPNICTIHEIADCDGQPFILNMNLTSPGTAMRTSAIHSPVPLAVPHLD